MASSKRDSFAFPGHLGWGSDPLSRALRNCSSLSTRQSAKFKEPLRPQETALPDSPKIDCAARLSNHEWIRVYPDLALALLRNKIAAPGRIWLLLKHIDEEGRGWLERKDVDRFLAQEGSKYRVCGRRQLRKLLSAGDGIFWRRSGGRIWLKSASKVAVTLNVRRLGGYPVSMPLNILLQGIGEVRAHLLGCYHSGHAGKDGLSKPIARSTLKDISSLSPRTQQKYEHRAGIFRQVNFVVGGRVRSSDIENRAWRHGRALFIYTDRQGRFGSSGAVYTAWQLPNSYRGPHGIRPKGRQKSINREIADLFTKGITGNSTLLEDDTRSSFERFSRRYFSNGQAAAKIYNLDPGRDRYWKGRVRPCSSDQIWHVFSGQQEIKIPA